MRSIIAALMVVAGIALLRAESIDNLAGNGRYLEADRQLQKLHIGNPDDPEYLLLMGRTAISGENSATSLKDYINKKPEDATLANWARLILGKYYLSQGLYVTAGRQFESIDTDSPFSREAAFLEARCSLLSGESDDAIAAYKTLLNDQRRPGDSWLSWASLGLADAYANAGEYDRAAEIYQRLLEPDFKETVMAPAIMGLAGLAEANNDTRLASVYYSMYNERFATSQSISPATRVIAPQKGPEDINPRSTKKHYIQIGVYSKRNNALKISSLYKKSGYDVYMENFEKEGQEFYRILIGGYDSKQQADFIKNRLEKATNEKYVLIER